MWLAVRAQGSWEQARQLRVNCHPLLRRGDGRVLQKLESAPVLGRRFAAQEKLHRSGAAAWRASRQKEKLARVHSVSLNPLETTEAASPPRHPQVRKFTIIPGDSRVLLNLHKSY